LALLLRAKCSFNLPPKTGIGVGDQIIMKIQKKLKNFRQELRFLRKTITESHRYSMLVQSRNYGFLLKDVKINFYNSRKHDGSFSNILEKRSPSHGTSQTTDEAYTLYSSMIAANDLEGDIAEVGVFRGGSAILICETKKDDKAVFLFDTFEGMPNNKINDSKDKWRPVWKDTTTHTKTSVETVRSYLAEFKNIHIIQGIFPESLESYKENIFEKKFCLVHLDVDLYQSTLDALEFFYPRLTTHGRIISHNYNLTYGKGGDTPGVRLAFEEYFQGKEYLIIEIADTQCLVVKPADDATLS
jgi:hypothetical protein